MGMIVALVIAAVFYFALGDILITALTEIVGSKEGAKKVLKGAVIFVVSARRIASRTTCHCEGAKRPWQSVSRSP